MTFPHEKQRTGMICQLFEGGGWKEEEQEQEQEWEWEIEIEANESVSRVVP